MTPLSQLTRRDFLIATHDALAAAFALLASLYLRFEGGEAFFDRLPQVLRILPFFVVWRSAYLLHLQPHDDEIAAHFTTGCVEHHARDNRPNGRAHRAGLCIPAHQQIAGIVAPKSRSFSTGSSKSSR